MNVKELIEKLNKLDPNLEVVHFSSADFSYSKVSCLRVGSKYAQFVPGDEFDYYHEKEIMQDCRVYI